MAEMEEPQFENEEEYLEYMVQMQKKQLEEDGINISESEIREKIKQQMMENQEGYEDEEMDQ